MKVLSQQFWDHLWSLLYSNSELVEDFELRYLYNLHSPANEFYAWSLHIDHDQIGSDWALLTVFI